MDSPTVLIPGAGGAAGIGAIRSLHHAAFTGTIIATDSDPLAAGLSLADVGMTVPRAKADGFFEAALDIITEYDVDIILPSSGFDIGPYAKRRDELRNRGVKPILSTPDTLSVCRNKRRFHDRIADDYPVPETTESIDADTEFPCFVKPVFGKGSDGARRCDSLNELDVALNTDQEMLVQEYLSGQEFTVDVLSDLTGTALRAVVRERVETKAGISFKGRTRRDLDLEAQCLSLAEELNLIGPSCMQLKIADDNTPKFLEVNPRLGGGTIISTCAGVNLPALTLELVQDETVSIPEPREITVSRYWEETIVE
jgi:carbamoyl-phosphate synthase large subunit